MKNLVIALLAFGVAVSGCRTGGLETEAVIATEPAGIRLAIELESGLLVGELLEVRSDGLLLNVDTGASTVGVDGPVVFLSEAAMPRSFRAGSDHPGDTEKGRLVGLARESHREWLSGLARFPYGIAPDVERRLLAAYGQSAIGRVLPGGAGGPPAEFLRRLESSAVRFQDPDSAIRRGYRKVGPDFPGMGQHWVNPGLVLSGGVDPTHPQILTYVDVEGTPRLTGVAFAAPLSAGEAPPPGPLPPALWHDHGGSLDEEALILESPRTADHSADGPRLAMVHVWLWPDNPDGRFAQNNWALGWVRRGLVPPDHVDPGVARALFLADGGEQYYGRLLTRIATDADAAIGLAVSRAARRASGVLDDLPEETNRLDPGVALALRGIWQELWDQLRAEVAPGAWSRLEPAYREWGGGR